MNSKDCAKYVRHSGIRKRVDRNDMKMAQTARRYFLTTSTRWAHSRPDLDVLNVKYIGLFAIVPREENQFGKLQHQLKNMFKKYHWR